MRFALIELASGIVQNVVEIDADDGSIDPEGFAHIASDAADIGDRWDGTKFVRAELPG
jgi:hypothetical protein